MKSFHQNNVFDLFLNLWLCFVAREFVLENPRPYDVVTLFTVKRGCEKCDELFYEYTGVSYSYG